MAKVKKTRKAPLWLLRVLAFAGRAILIIVDYLDDNEMNGSSLDFFNRIKSMFEVAEDSESSPEESEVQNG